MKKFNIFFEKVIGNLFAVIFMLILIILLVWEKEKYSRKTEFGISNIKLLLISLICISVISVCIYIKRKKVEAFLSKNWKVKIGIAAVILFIIQVYICYNIYFLTGWDPDYILNDAANIASGSSVRNDYYFSRYPNNLFITGVFSVIFKVSNFFIKDTIGRHLMVCAVIQSILSSVSGIIIFLMIKDIFKSFIDAWFGWILYAILLGTSAWLVIPYSDSMGLIFPILIFRLYYLLKNGKHIYLKWCLISVLTYIGYCIKPQIAILFIAIVIVEIVNFISNYEKYDLKRKAPVVAVAAVSFLFTSIIASCFIDSLGYKIDSSKKIGISHFAMMGLNSSTDGAFSKSDADFSCDQPDQKTRRDANIRVIKQRIKDYDAHGFTMHLIRKTLINFNDGTFALGQEGWFYKEVYKEKNNRFCQILRNIFYTEGSHYKYYSLPKQTVWLLVLFCAAACIINKPKLKKYDLEVVYLSLIGLTLFEMIFEARARYIYIYVPLFIIAGVAGYKKIVTFIKYNKELLKSK